MPDRRILITGACGFTGRHLAARLRRAPQATLIGIDTAPETPGLVDTYLRCDLTDPDAVGRAVQQARPHLVFHLAGLMTAASAEQMRRVNVDGLVCLCDALRRYRADSALPVRLLTIGSAAEVGRCEAARLPVTEEVPCAPQSAYGRSKLEATRLALAEPIDGPLAVVVARSFNLVGPGLSPQLSLGSFAQQIVAFIRGQTDAVRCGALDTRRDFLDIHDALEAYLALAERGRPGQIYNVCAGRSYRIGDLLKMLIFLAGTEVPVITDPSRHRPSDVPEIYGDHSKITRQMGWKPTVPIEQSLAGLLAAASGTGGPLLQEPVA